MRKTIKAKVAKINQIVELVREHRVIPAAVLTKKIYGSATRENMLKLQRLITVCRKQGCKTENIYCIRGNYIDISSICKSGSEK